MSNPHASRGSNCDVCHTSGSWPLTLVIAIHRIKWPKYFILVQGQRLCHAAKCGTAEGGYTNDVFIDITDVADKKVAALDCLVSQGYGGAYARKRIETSDGAMGMAGGVAYAEAFISQQAETHYHLPVTTYASGCLSALRIMS